LYSNPNTTLTPPKLMVYYTNEFGWFTKKEQFDKLIERYD